MKKNKRTIINILGTPYLLKVVEKIDDGDAYGVINYDDKTINIAKYNPQVDHTIIHELVHGYLRESGLMDWSSNEMLVNWIAYHAPKIMNAFNDITFTDEYDDLNEDKYIDYLR